MLSSATLLRRRRMVALLVGFAVVFCALVSFRPSALVVAAGGDAVVGSMGMGVVTTPEVAPSVTVTATAHPSDEAAATTGCGGFTACGGGHMCVAALVVLVLSSLAAGLLLRARAPAEHRDDVQHPSSGGTAPDQPRPPPWTVLSLTQLSVIRV